jgi:hypothetical protein
LGMCTDLCCVTRSDKVSDRANILRAKLVQRVDKPLVLVWGPVSRLRFCAFVLGTIFLAVRELCTECIDLAVGRGEFCF